MTGMTKNRRQFIKSSSAIATAAFFPFSILGSRPGDQVRVGVIGAGSRGQGLMRLMDSVDGLKVTAFSEIIPFRIEEARSLAKDASSYRDYRNLLDRKDIDAVVIATPFSMHAKMAVDALNAGKHVYCEKTMAKGISGIQKTIDSVKNSGKVFQTGHQYHSSPLYKKVVKMVNSDYLGEITSFECQWNRNGNWRRTVPDPKWEKMINWRMYREYSGGLTAELCSHQIDFINWVLDETPVKIAGFGGIDHWKDGRETYDNIHQIFEYPSGVDASFKCTTTNGFEDYKIRILGKKATVILDYSKADIYLENHYLKDYGMVDGVSGATKTAWKRGEGAPIEAGGSEDPTIDALKQFHSSIVEDAPVLSDVKTGANTAKCVQMCLDAMYDEKIAYWQDYPELRF